MPSTSRIQSFYDSPDIAKKRVVSDGQNRPASTHPRPIPEPVPVGPIAKRECLSQGFFEAYQLLRSQLRHHDEKIASNAAHTIISLQQTQLRHGGQIMGTHMPDSVCPLPALEQVEEVRYETGPDVEAMPEPVRIQWMNLLTALQRELQHQADNRGLGEFISIQECTAKAMPTWNAIQAEVAAKQKQNAGPMHTPHTE
jgi:hypothetical protein